MLQYHISWLLLIDMICVDGVLYFVGIIVIYMTENERSVTFQCICYKGYLSNDHFK